jgi:hypothetical protein
LKVIADLCERPFPKFWVVDPFNRNVVVVDYALSKLFLDFCKSNKKVTQVGLRATVKFGFSQDVDQAGLPSASASRPGALGLQVAKVGTKEPSLGGSKMYPRLPAAVRPGFEVPSLNPSSRRGSEVPAEDKWELPPRPTNFPGRGRGRGRALASAFVVPAFPPQSVGKCIEDQLDPAMFGNVEASEESRMAARKDRRQELIHYGMGDISNKGVVNTGANDPVSAWNACQPDSKKELDAWKAHRESEMNKKKQEGQGKRASA